MTNIQVYADTFSAEAENEVMNVTLTNVDESLLFGQFSFADVAAHFDLSDIIDYVHGNNGENE